MNSRNVDVAVLGAGSAGLAAVSEIQKAGKSFVLINGGPYGTTCARTGCMPTKALIQIANDFHQRHVFPKEGIRGGEGLRIDLKKVLTHIRSLRDGFVKGVMGSVEGIGKHNILGYARFVEPTVLIVGRQTIRAKRVIIATGSRPVVPAAWEPLRGKILTSDDLFESESLPSSMGVIGLGASGLELCQALGRLGIDVIGMDQSSFMGGLSDPKINRSAAGIFGKELRLWQGREALVQAQGEKLLIRSGRKSAAVEKILCCIGRRPNLDRLGLESLGIKLSMHGVPDFDPATTQLGRLPIFIAGDASDDRSILPEAVDAGHIAGFNAVQTAPHRFKRRVSLKITFSQPNLALVGKSPADLKGRETCVGESDFRFQARASLQASNSGLLRVYGEAGTGRILGAQMVAPSGEHLAHLCALAIQQEMTVFDFLRMPVYHPVLEEGLRDALRDLAKKTAKGFSKARLNRNLL